VDPIPDRQWATVCKLHVSLCISLCAFLPPLFCHAFSFTALSFLLFPTGHSRPGAIVLILDFPTALERLLLEGQVSHSEKLPSCLSS
jgi:hypothetical protein